MDKTNNKPTKRLYSLREKQQVMDKNETTLSSYKKNAPETETVLLNQEDVEFISQHDANSLADSSSSPKLILPLEYWADKARDEFKKKTPQDILRALAMFNGCKTQEEKRAYLQMMNEPDVLKAYESLRNRAQKECVQTSETDQLNYTSATAILKMAAKDGLPMVQQDVAVIAMNLGELEVAQEHLNSVLNNDLAGETQKRMSTYYLSQINSWENGVLEGVSINEGRKRNKMAEKEISEYIAEHPDMKEAVLRHMADRGYPTAQKQYASMMQSKGGERASVLAQKYMDKYASNIYTSKKEGVLAKIVHATKKNAKNAALCAIVATAGILEHGGVLNKTPSEYVEEGVQKTTEVVKKETNNIVQINKRQLNNILKVFSGDEKRANNSSGNEGVQNDTKSTSSNNTMGNILNNKRGR